MSSTIERLKVPFVLLVVCVLSYGLLTPWLGFYWDDWPLVMISHSLGKPGLAEFESQTRPLAGWLQGLTMRLMGETPFPWHMLALFERWLSSVGAWWLFSGLWPSKRWQAAGAALLFATYPGFTQQPLALSYANEFVPLVGFILSLAAMVWAQRLSRLFWPMTLLALMGSALGGILSEYYLGLELIRPAVLWLIVSEDTQVKLKRWRLTLNIWMPYLILWLILVASRILLPKGNLGYKDASGYFSSILADPVRAILTRGRNALTDLIGTTVLVWGQVVSPDAVDFSSRSVWVAVGLALIGGLFVVLSLKRLTTPANLADSGNEDSREKSWSMSAITIGLIALCLGGLPVWFGNRHMTLQSLNDRYSLAAMLGACLLTVAIIHRVVRSQRYQVAAIGILVAFSISFHFRNANSFRQDWEAQRSLFWQLSWRAPGLQRGTSILMEQRPVPVPGSFEALGNDYSLSAPLNLIYAPTHTSARLDYWFFNLTTQLGDEVPQLTDDTPLYRQLVTVSFSGSTSTSLALWVSPSGCLRVLDPSRDVLPALPPLARAAQELSHVDRIEMDGTPLSRARLELFGPEPPPCWCYYFEKADLARQMGHWTHIGQLGDEARQKGLGPKDATEWLPFIEGYVELKRYEDAREIVGQVLGAPPTGRVNSITSGSLTAGPTIAPALAHMWKRLEGQNQTDQARSAFIAEMKIRVGTESAQIPTEY